MVGMQPHPVICSCSASEHALSWNYVFIPGPLCLVRIIYVWQVSRNTLPQKLSMISKAGSCGPRAQNDLFTLELQHDLELLMKLACWWRNEEALILQTSLLPWVARGEGRCFPRRGGGTLRSARGISIVCVINESVLPTLSFNVSAPPKNISFRVLRLGLRFMRPNLQAMCAWIKGTWDCLFMSDPRKFPVSCLSELLAQSMMGKSGLCSHSIFPAHSESKSTCMYLLTDPLL